jgi:hypothetical protein
MSSEAEFIKLNDFPHDNGTGVLCRDPVDDYGPHVTFKEDFYVSSDHVIKEGKFSNGTIVKKIKSIDNAINVITIMRKIDDRANGGTWNYTMYNSGGIDITKEWERKFNLSCIDCHEKYSKSEYLSSTFWDYYKTKFAQQGDAPEPASPAR